MGVYIGTQVNANEVTDLMIEEIGQSAYFLQGPLSENIVKGGFVSGHGGNVRPPLSPSILLCLGLLTAALAAACRRR